MDDPIARRAALKRVGAGVAIPVLGGCLGTAERSEPTAATSSRTTRTTRPSTTTVSAVEIGESVPVGGGRLTAATADLQRFVLDVYKHPHADVVSDPSKKYLSS